MEGEREMPRQKKREISKLASVGWRQMVQNLGSGRRTLEQIGSKREKWQTPARPRGSLMVKQQSGNVF